MAGNSSVFYLRQEVNEANIKQWQSWSVDINYVVEQFNDVVQNLNDRLDMAYTTIDALTVKVNKLAEKVEALDLEYINLQFDSLEINSAKDSTYTKTCGVFSSNALHSNTINVFSTKSISGLYINDKQVYAQRIGNYNQPFAQIAGSDQGTVITIKSNNMTKIGGNIELYFAFDSSLTDSSLSQANSTNDIALLKIKPKYSQAIVKPIITLNNSALSKTLTKTITPISTDALSVSKYAAPIGRYSTTKTVAQVAKQATKLLTGTVNVKAANTTITRNNRLL